MIGQAPLADVFVQQAIALCIFVSCMIVIIDEAVLALSDESHEHFISWSLPVLDDRKPCSFAQIPNLSQEIAFDERTLCT